MNTSEKLEYYIMVGDQINTLWEFFVSIHLAIIVASYAIRKADIGKIEYSILIISYLSFSAINWRAKYNAYTLLSAIKNSKTDKNEASLPIDLFFNGMYFDDRYAIITIIHIFSIIFMGILFWIRHNKHPYNSEG
ncbi:MAG: hypothetical protein ACRBB3_02025 [Alphaproteobacteria bacterium]